MTSEFMLSQGAGQELEFAVIRNGGTAADIEWLSTGENFKRIAMLRTGAAVVSIPVDSAKVAPAYTYQDERVRIIDASNMEVNLDAPLTLPFSGATIETDYSRNSINVGILGWAKVARVGDDLYVDGVKVEFFLSAEQQNGSTVKGKKLRTETVRKRGVHPNIMDALQKYGKQMIPDKYKTDGQGRVVFMYSWAVIFRNSGGDLCVRYWCWGDGALQSGFYWLDRDWDSEFPALVVASAK